MLFGILVQIRGLVLYHFSQYLFKQMNVYFFSHDAVKNAFLAKLYRAMHLSATAFVFQSVTCTHI